MGRSSKKSGVSTQGSCDDKLFYASQLEKLDVPEELKRKVIKLANKVDETFRISPSQREKVRRFSEQIQNLDVSNLRGKFKMPTIWKPVEGEIFNKSAFTPEETETLEQNYLKFCKKFNFHPTEDINIFLPNTLNIRTDESLSVHEKHVFVHYISKNIDRPPRSVYTKFWKLFYFCRSGSFTQNEDDVLRSWYELKPGKYMYSVLGRILRRSRFLVRRRLLRLIDARDNKKKRLMPGSHCTDEISKLDKNEYPDWTKDEEAWKKMAKMNGEYSVKELKKSYFREVYPSVKATRKIRSLNFKRSLIELLCSMENPSWDTVDWVKLGEDCFNVGAVRVYSVIRTLTRKYAPRECWNNLADSLQKIKENNKELAEAHKIPARSRCVNITRRTRKSKKSKSKEDTVERTYSHTGLEQDSIGAEEHRSDEDSDEHSDVMMSSLPKKKRAKSETLQDAEDVRSETQAEVENEESADEEFSPQHNVKRVKSKTVEETVDIPIEDTVEHCELTVSPRRKKKRAKLENADEVKSETQSDVDDEKSTADERSPQRNVKKVESKSVEESVEREDTEVAEFKDVGETDEQSVVMVSTRRRKKCAKFQTFENAHEMKSETETVDETNDHPFSEIENEDDIGAEEVKYVEDTVGHNEVMVSPRRKTKQTNLQRVEGSDEVQIKTCEDAKEVEDGEIKN